jgi:hypothetical protein
MVGHMAWVLVAGQDVVSVGIIDYWTLVIFVCQQHPNAVLAIFLKVFPGFT